MTHSEDLINFQKHRIEAMTEKIDDLNDSLQRTELDNSIKVNELESRIAYLEANIEVLNNNIKSFIYENE